MSRSRRNFDLLMQFWPLGKYLNAAGKWPLVGPLLKPCFDGEGNEAVIIPVQEAVQGTESVVLPFQLLEPLVQRASARVILDNCLCRRGEGCRTYPHEIGCLFLGDGAAEIGGDLGRPVGVDGALAHLQRGMDAGLVPLVVHSSFDTWMLGIPYRQTLAICFCCDCCCSIRQGLRSGPEVFWETVNRLPGLSVFVSEECTACGACLDVCHVQAISIVDGKAQVGEACKGCGRCVDCCPEQALALSLDRDEDPLAGLLARFEQRTTIEAADTRREP